MRGHITFQYEMPNGKLLYDHAKPDNYELEQAESNPVNTWIAKSSYAEGQKTTRLKQQN